MDVSNLEYSSIAYDASRAGVYTVNNSIDLRYYSVNGEWILLGFFDEDNFYQTNDSNSASLAIDCFILFLRDGIYTIVRLEYGSLLSLIQEHQANATCRGSAATSTMSCSTTSAFVAAPYPTRST